MYDTEKMHKWTQLHDRPGVLASVCSRCSLARQRTVNDEWEYWIGGSWTKLHAVPKCVPGLYSFKGVRLGQLAGTAKVELEMTGEDAAELLRSCHRGDLDDLGITNLRIKYDIPRHGP